MFVLIVRRDIHAKSMYFVLVYTQDEVKSGILVELPIVLGFEGGHHREWVVHMYKNH